MKKVDSRFLFLIILIVIPYLLLAIILLNKNLSLTRIENSNIVIVDKSNLNLFVYNFNGKLINRFPVSIGKNFGNKVAQNDSKTPEGIFRIMSVEDASDWSFDFEDDYEPAITGAYGQWFVRLEVPGHRGIGIHGNLDRYPIGYRNSHGCIRMDNKDLNKFVRLINPNSIVIITPSLDDLIEDSIFNSNSGWVIPEKENGVLFRTVDDSITDINY
jgi:lipoprotein-anchoring transpeptidase ErfK/SrfK